jgi:hypothetical protein
MGCTMIALAAAVFGAALIVLPTTEAAARAQVRDNRGGVAKPDTSGPGHALPGKTYIKCIIPFCSHDFAPSRARVQDHRSNQDKKPKT